jgi:hypothetical protein
MKVCLLKFNLLARMKCNRCGIAKTPKRNVNKNMKYSKGNNMMNNNLLLQNNQNNQINQISQISQNNQHSQNNQNFNNHNNIINQQTLNISPSNLNIDGLNLNPQQAQQFAQLMQSQENPDQLSLNSDDEDDSKKKKPFAERVGDWVCIKCKNLNFSFRVICNRCQLPKMESDKMFEQYMGNLMNYVKLNEIMQQQILQQGNVVPNNPPKSYVNNNSININNNFYNAPNVSHKQAKNSNKFESIYQESEGDHYYENQA